MTKKTLLRANGVYLNPPWIEHTLGTHNLAFLTLGMGLLCTSFNTHLKGAASERVIVTSQEYIVWPDKKYSTIESGKSCLKPTMIDSPRGVLASR